MSCTDLESYDFVVRQGFDKTLKCIAKADGEVVDLTGSIMRFNCSLDLLDQDAVITDALAGEFMFVFPKAITSGLEQRRVKYEVSRIIGGTDTPMFVGSINLTPKVT